METIKTNAIESYVAEVARLLKTGKATEHTFRGALAALLDALAPGLKAVNEPKRTDCGAPDYIVQDKTGLGVFYVEAKDLGDDDLDGKKRAGHKEQFDRYKAALDTIILTAIKPRLIRSSLPITSTSASIATDSSQTLSESQIGMERARSLANLRHTQTSPRLWPMPQQATPRRSIAPSVSLS